MGKCDNYQGGMHRSEWRDDRQFLLERYAEAVRNGDQAHAQELRETLDIMKQDKADRQYLNEEGVYLIGYSTHR